MRVCDDPRDAARALLDGRLAILPTETVYGLAARADDPTAIARLYATKGRPSAHPVIVHLADAAAALDPRSGWAAGAPDYAHALADAAWPGPLTLVLTRGPRAGDDVTGGQDSVGLRVPGHPVALAVLAAMDELDPDGAPHGIAAPSANRFGRVSPTTLAHALDELADVLDADDVALDGGDCAVGVESTIVDCRGAVPAVLRPGHVGAAQIEKVTGLSPRSSTTASTRVPGSLPSHYAPRAEVVVSAHAAELAAQVDDARARGVTRIGALVPRGVAVPDGVGILLEAASSADYARGLYAALRRGDAQDVELIVAVAPVDDGGAGDADAVRDRLLRASAPRKEPGRLRTGC